MRLASSVVFPNGDGIRQVSAGDGAELGKELLTGRIQRRRHDAAGIVPQCPRHRLRPLQRQLVAHGAAFVALMFPPARNPAPFPMAENERIPGIIMSPVPTETSAWTLAAFGC